MLSKPVFLPGLLFLCLFFSLNVFGQQTPVAHAPSVSASPEAMLLRSLLEEVRQLRAAVQRANISLYRAQMLTDRLARQQNRVEGLTAEIDQLKEQIQQASDSSNEDEDLKDLEAAVREAPDPQTRAQLLQIYNSQKRAILRQRETARAETERNQARQAQLENTLRTEQARLAEIQEQLEAIDREIDKPATEGRKSK